MSKNLSRRDFLRYAGVAAAGAVVASCAPAPAAEPKTVEVEVTRIVEGETEVEVQVVTATPDPNAVAPAPSVTIEFWSMNYGDTEIYLQLMRDIAGEFEADTGVTADIQIVNWSTAVKTWLLVSQGGAHPDAADMFWLYSNSELGGDQAGPMPITEYQDTYWPDLEERFFAGSLKDVFWKGEFYGIPWRGDIRPQLYRVDMLEQAGFSAPPDTWEDVTNMAKALTKRDDAGNVTQWGFSLAGSVPLQQFMQYLWQAGGEFMTADGSMATVDTPEMRDTLNWIYDLLWTSEVHPTDLMEQGYDPTTMLEGGQLAMIGSVPDSTGQDLERDFPELDGKWAMAIPTMGPANRSSYSGAGYWGVLRGTEKVDEAVQWIAWLSKDENMMAIDEMLVRVSPNKNVMASPFWSDREWKKVITKTLEYAHTSQYPSQAWAVMTAKNPGAVMYDLFYEAIVEKQPIDDVLARAQQRAQDEMDKAVS